MLEDLLTSLLAGYLGDYFEDITPESLKVAVWKGHVSLEGLALRRDALERFPSLPFRVLAGSVGSLALDIPWKKLKSQPARARLSRVNILLGPRAEDAEAAVHDPERFWQRKLRELQAAEAEAFRPTPETANKPVSADTLSGRITEMILNNLQVDIANVHIRFEDHRSPGSPVAMGWIFDSLAFVSTDDRWRPAFQPPAGGLTAVHKQGQIDGLCAYHSMDGVRVQDHSDWIARMDELQQNRSQGAGFGLIPMEATLRLTLLRQPPPDPTTPRIALTILLPHLSVTVHQAQFEYWGNLWYAASHLFWGRVHFRWRPALPVARAPGAWWRFAVRSVLWQLGTQKSERQHAYMPPSTILPWSWPHMARRRDVRKEYVDLYVLKIDPEKTISDAQLDRLENIERVLDTSDILLYRHLAEVAVADALAAAAAAASSSSSTATAKTSGRTRWQAFKSSLTVSRQRSSSTASSDRRYQLTDDQLRELWAAVDYAPHDPSQPAAVYAADQVEFRATVVVESGFIHLTTGSSHTKEALACAVLRDLRYWFDKRPLDYATGFTAVDLQLLDTASGHSQHLAALSRRGVADPDKPMITFEYAYEPAIGTPAVYRMHLALEPADLHVRPAFFTRLISLIYYFLQNVWYGVPSSVPVVFTDCDDDMSTLLTASKASLRSWFAFCFRSRVTFDISGLAVFLCDHPSNPRAALVVHMDRALLQTSVLDPRSQEAHVAVAFQHLISVSGVSVRILPVDKGDPYALKLDSDDPHLVAPVDLSVTVDAEASVATSDRHDSLKVAIDIPSDVALHLDPAGYESLLLWLGLSAVPDTPAAVAPSAALEAPPVAKAVLKARKPHIKIWHAYEFELRDSLLLYYPENPNNRTSRPVGLIHLDDYALFSSGSEDLVDENAVFGLRSVRKVALTDYYFRAPSREIALEFVAGIRAYKTRVRQERQQHQQLLQQQHHEQQHRQSVAAELIQREVPYLDLRPFLLFSTDVVLKARGVALAIADWDNRPVVHCHLSDATLESSVDPSDSGVLAATIATLVLSDRVRDSRHDLATVARINAKSSWVSGPAPSMEVALDCQSIDAATDAPRLSALVDLFIKWPTIDSAAAIIRLAQATNASLSDDDHDHGDGDGDGDGGARAPAVDSDHVRFRVVANVERVTLCLSDSPALAELAINEDDAAVDSCRVTLDVVAINVAQRAESVASSATLGGALASVTSSHNDDRQWVDLIRLDYEHEPMVSVRFGTISRSDPRFAGFDTNLRIEVSAMRIVYWRPLFVKLHRLSRTPTFSQLLRLVLGYSVRTLETMDENSNLMDIRIRLHNPTIEFPPSLGSPSKIVVTLDTASVTTSHDAGQLDAVQTILVQVTSFAVFAALRTDTGIRSSALLRQASAEAAITRVLHTTFTSASQPKYSVYSSIGDLVVNLSDTQYQLVTAVWTHNLAKVPHLSEPDRASAELASLFSDPSVSDAGPSQDSLYLAFQLALPRVALVTYWDTPADSALGNADGDLPQGALGQFAIEDLSISLKHARDHSSKFVLSVGSLRLDDIRHDSPSAHFRNIFAPNSSGAIRAPTRLGDLGAPSAATDSGRHLAQQREVQQHQQGPNYAMLLVEANQDPTTGMSVNVLFDNPLVILVPETLVVMGEFFLPPSARRHARRRQRLASLSSASAAAALSASPQEDLHLSRNHVLDRDLRLSDARRLFVRPHGVQKLVLDGGGHTIYCDPASEDPLILIAPRKTLVLKNVTVSFAGMLLSLVSFGDGSNISTRVEDGVVQRPLDADGVFFGDDEDDAAASPRSPLPGIPPPSPSTPTSKPVRIKISVTHPQAWIPADPRDKDSGALALQLSLLAQASLGGAPGGIEAQCSLQNVEIFGSPKILSETGAVAILEPVHATLEYTSARRRKRDSSMAPRPALVELQVGQIDMRVSFKDCLTVISAMDSMAASLVDAGGSPAKPPRRASRRRPPRQHHAPRTTFELSRAEEKAGYANLEGVRLVLIDDRGAGQQQVPLLDVQLDACHSSGAFKDGVVRATLPIVAWSSFYNPAVAGWEPLVEPWKAGVDIGAAGGSLTLNVVSDETFNINTSVAFFDAMLAALNDWHDASSKGDAIYAPAAGAAHGESFHSHWLQNDTGVDVVYSQLEQATGGRHRGSIGAAQPVSLADDQAVLPPGSRTGLSPHFQADYTRTGKQRQMAEASLLRLAVQLDERGAESEIISTVEEIVTDHDGTAPFKFVSVRHSPVAVVVESRMVRGSKIVRLRSGIGLRNLLNMPVEVLVRVPDVGTSVIGPMVLDERRAVSVVLIPGGAATFRPSALHEWSDLRVNLDSLHSMPACTHLVCQPVSSAPPGTQPVSFTVSLRRLQPFDAEIVIGGSVLLHNLLTADALCRLSPDLDDVSGGARRSEFEVSRGEQGPLTYVDMTRPQYLMVSLPGVGDQIKPVLVYHPERKDLVAKTLQLRDAVGNAMSPIQIETWVDPVDGCYQVALYAQYWLRNRASGVSLAYGKASVTGPEPAGVLGYGTPSLPDSMFSFGSDKFGGNKLVVKSTERSPKTKWSNRFGIDQPGSTGMVAMSADVGKSACYVGVSIHLCPPPFQRTKVITFAPRFVLVNKMHRSVMVRQPVASQRGASVEALLVRPEQSHALYWLQRDAPMQLSLRFLQEHGEGIVRSSSPALSTSSSTSSSVAASTSTNAGSGQPGQVESEWEWSPVVDINAIGEHFVKMQTRSDTAKRRLYIGRVEVSLQDATLTIVIKPESAYPPYRIQNRSWYKMRYRQKGSDGWEHLGPHMSAPYAWDRPMDSRKLEVELNGDNSTQRTFVLDKIGELDKTEVDGGVSPVWPRIFARGPTKVLRIGYDAETSDITERDDEQSHRIRLQIEGVGVSVIGPRPSEIAYISVSGVLLSLSASAANRRFECIANRLQVDDQYAATSFPVAIAPTKPDQQPFFHASVVQSLVYEDVLYFDYVSVLMQALTAKVEDRFAQTLFDTFAPVLRKISAVSGDGAGPAGESASRMRSGSGRADGSGAPGAQQHEKEMYVELLHLHPIQINVTLVSVISEEQQRQMSRNSSLTMMYAAIGGLRNVDNLPLRLNALVLENPYERKRVLVSRIMRHYQRQLVQEIYKMLGSADALGNPVGLVSNLGTGIKDFFYEPAKGVVSSPEAFAKGLAKGTMSLLKNSIHGTFNVASSITGSLGRGISALSMDSDYMMKRQTEQNQRVRHVGEGLLGGAEALGKGIFRGVTGIVTQPIEGARASGVGGFVKGVGRGILGAAVKPVSGVLDFAHLTTAGIRNTTTIFDGELRRARPPRVIGRAGPIRPYSLEDALGQDILHRVDRGKWRNEEYRSHVSANRESSTLVLLSTQHLFAIAVPDANASRAAVEFVGQLNRITGIVIGQRAVTVRFAIPKGERSSFFGATGSGGRVRELGIPCDGRETVEAVYRLVCGSVSV